MSNTASARTVSRVSLMDRLQSLRSKRYRVWAPVESPVRIEYTQEVLREAARHACGVLYGVRSGKTIRVIAARREQPRPKRIDPRISRLELLGTFAFRARGEIFLTESDLEQLELTGGLIALIVSGTNAGFFVYEADGAIETIRSHQEFSILKIPPPYPPPAIPGHAKLWISLACLAVLAVSVAATPRSQPLALTVRKDARQLRIHWTPRTFESGGLEIDDGARRTRIFVSNDFSSVTYVPQSSDVNVRLTAGSRVESARFVGIDPAP